MSSPKTITGPAVEVPADGRWVAATTALPDVDGTFDPAYAHTLESTDDVWVEYQYHAHDDDLTTIELLRIVTRKAYYMRDRVILWMQVVAVFPTANVPEHVRDLTTHALHGTAK
jgi:hypothetical protein